MKISIIVPVYNIKEYLPGCLESIAAQQYTDYEAIIVDDGSTDGSAEICDNFAALAKTKGRFKVIHKPNNGPSSARNTGAEAAKGEYLVFLDGDDTFTPDALSTIAQNLTDDVVFFRHLVQDSGQVLPCRFTYAAERAQGIGEIADMVFFPGNINNWSIWGKAYRREFFIQNALFNDVDAYGCEDFDFIMRLIFAARTVGAVNAPIVVYVADRGNSITNTANFKRLHNLTLYLQKWAQNIQKAQLSQGLTDKFYAVFGRQLISVITAYPRFTLPQKKQIKPLIKECAFLLRTSKNSAMRTAWLMLKVGGPQLAGRVLSAVKTAAIKAERERGQTTKTAD